MRIDGKVVLHKGKDLRYMTVQNRQVKIVEYDSEYREATENLLVELEQYLISLDEDRLDIIGDGYKEKMLEYELSRIKRYNGKCLLAIREDSVIGMIMGIQRKYLPEDYLDYSCPKAGIVTELIIKDGYRGHSAGQILLQRMEEFFLENGCEYMFTDVFAYNTSALRFYEQKGYHSRMHTIIKKLSLSL